VNASKICTHCKIDKPLSDYYSKGNRLDAKCKDCVKKGKKKNRKAIKKKKEASSKRRKSSNTIDLINFQVRLSGELSSSSLEELVGELIKEAS
jgi:hypothetical protein